MSSFNFFLGFALILSWLECGKKRKQEAEILIAAELALRELDPKGQAAQALVLAIAIEKAGHK